MAKTAYIDSTTGLVIANGGKIAASEDCCCGLNVPCEDCESVCPSESGVCVEMVGCGYNGKCYCLKKYITLTLTHNSTTWFNGFAELKSYPTQIHWQGTSSYGQFGVRYLTGGETPSCEVFPTFNGINMSTCGEEKTWEIFANGGTITCINPPGLPPATWIYSWGNVIYGV
jgi:hypothetical protein